MLTQARIIEMNITICKFLQARSRVSKAEAEALTARIALFVRLLEAMEKHGSCIIIPDTEKCDICSRTFSETRDRGGEEEIVHCCFRRVHTGCLDALTEGYSRTDMASTCGRCSGKMNKEVLKRIEKYGEMCVQKESPEPSEENDWLARLMGTLD